MSQYTRYIQGHFDDLTYFVSSADYNSNTILPGNDNVVCLRFTNVTIPAGATITSAYLKGKSEDDNTDDVYLRVYGIDEDNTADFSVTQLGRTKTTANVNWDMTSVTTDTVYTSPDIKDIVQEIIGRGGWSSGNSMGFYLDDDGSAIYNYYIFYDYSDGQNNSFYLEINYTTSTNTNDVRSAKITGTLGAYSERSASIKSDGIYDARSAKLKGKSTSNSERSARVTDGTDRGNYGIKVTKPGYDVKTETDIKNMIFTSARGVLGLRRVREYTSTTDANGNIELTVYHNFGYVPIVIVKVETYDGKEVTINPTEWHSYYEDVVHGELEVTERFDFELTATTFTMKVYASESDNIQEGYFAYLSGRSYTFQVYYYFNELTDE